MLFLGLFAIASMETFDQLPPAYLPEPIFISEISGPRPQFQIEDSYFYYYFTRRSPEYGPYGLFIKWIEEPALYSRHYPRPDYIPHWEEAGPQISRILWGSLDERRDAKERLKAVNEYINTEINAVNGEEEGNGNIPVENWFQAGEQLALAVRDVVHFRSTARFEDVRDFICELIENFSYPKDWRVRRFIFEQKVADQLPNAHCDHDEWWDNSAVPSEPDDSKTPTARKRLRLSPRNLHREEGETRVRMPSGQHTASPRMARRRQASRSSAPHLPHRRGIPTRNSNETTAPDRTRRRRMRSALQWRMMNEDSPAMSELARIR